MFVATTMSFAEATVTRPLTQLPVTAGEPQVEVPPATITLCWKYMAPFAGTLIVVGALHVGAAISIAWPLASEVHLATSTVPLPLKVSFHATALASLYAVPVSVAARLMSVSEVVKFENWMGCLITVRMLADVYFCAPFIIVGLPVIEPSA